MTNHFKRTGFLIDIIDDLERNAAIYFPHFGNITGVELTSLTQRKHCEIAEVRVQFSLENIDLIVKLLGGSREEGVAKARQEQANIMSYASLLSRSPFQALRTVGDFSQYQAIITKKASGVLLKELFNVCGRMINSYVRLTDLERYCEEAGKWLKWVHNYSYRGTHHAFQGDELVETISQNYSQCVSLGLDPNMMDLILGKAKEILGRCRNVELPIVMAHNDFTPENILVDVDKDSLVVLDFQAVERTATPYHDVALFISSLECLAKYPVYRVSHVEGLKRAFFHGYGNHRLSPVVLKIFQANVILTMHRYLASCNDERDFRTYVRHYAYRRFVRNWLVKTFTEMRCTHHGSD